MKVRKDFSSIREINDFLSGGDISWLDDTGICNKYFKAGHSAPNIIGPITRSPIKDYHGWKSNYPKEWFYKARIIRLNYNEERDNHELVTLIRHGVDTEKLKPSDKPKKYILWAGDKNRYAKNYNFWLEILANTKLPKGYEFKTLYSYNVIDYWNILDETAIFVNTSLYESFCSALFEAKAKGIPTIYPKNLHGVGVHEKSKLQVEYTPEDFRDTILRLLNDEEELKKLGEENRKYVLENASFKVMRDDIVKVIKEVYNEKNL